MISEILMQGRVLSGGGSAWFWCICQRADNSYFSNGVRDNFMVKICLGKASTETKKMLFPGELEDIDASKVFRTGEGIILIDGQSAKIFKVPQIDDKEKLLQLLQEKAQN
jgi:hypothetical protein